MKVKNKKRKKLSTVKENKKPGPYIATDGTVLKSRLELYFYNKCLEFNIPVEYEKQSYEIFPEFMFDGKKIRSINYTPDFDSDKFIVEIKGFNFSDIAFTLRFKLFKKYMVDNKINKKLYLLKNQKQVNEALEEIKTL